MLQRSAFQFQTYGVVKIAITPMMVQGSAPQLIAVAGCCYRGRRRRSNSAFQPGAEATEVDGAAAEIDPAPLPPSESICARRWERLLMPSELLNARKDSQFTVS